jgi:hypothetical protein
MVNVPGEIHTKVKPSFGFTRVPVDASGVFRSDGSEAGLHASIIGAIPAAKAKTATTIKRFFICAT